MSLCSCFGFRNGGPIMLREKEVENTVGYVLINFILKQLEKDGKITANESENVDKNISELLNVEYKYSCRIV